MPSDAKLHDHSTCAHDPARANAGRGVDLTPARRRILDELCAAEHPIGAYEMIDRLARRGDKRPAPISVYRVLDFLVEHGLVHRLASRNAYMACSHGHDSQEAVVFLICDSCGKVKEAPSGPVRRNLGEVAKANGFAARAQMIEVNGLCGACRTNAAAT